MTAHVMAVTSSMKAAPMYPESANSTHLPDDCGTAFANRIVWELEACEDPREQVCFHHDFRKIHAVLCDLGQRAAGVAAQAGLWAHHQRSKERYCPWEVHAILINPRPTTPFLSLAAHTDSFSTTNNKQTFSVEISFFQ